MKLLLVLISVLAYLPSVIADLGVTIYKAKTGQNQLTTPGCVYVGFQGATFSGKIGNVTFAISSPVVYVQSDFNGTGQRLNSIPYSVTSGTLFITEVR